jgi:aspartyl-tRNA synthetase
MDSNYNNHMQRTHIKDLLPLAGSKVCIEGFVHALRLQSKIAFMNVRDVSGIVQIVIGKESSEFEKVKTVSLESVVKVTGLAKAEKNAPGGVEIQIETLEILSAAAPELPIPVVIKSGEDTEANTRFDYRWIDLRKPERTKIFKIWTELEKGFREYWDQNGFMQIYTPAFMSTASETGAEVFEVKYFDRKAYLAQSPQFYKQMAMASGFEKVFMVGPVFRAEESFTTRHMTEFTGWDFELSYVNSHHDVMDAEEGMIVAGFERLKKSFPDMNIEVPVRPFPRVSIVEAKKILKEKGVPSGEDHDLSPEEERAMSDYVKEKYGHDFIFITDYHKSKSAFYHMRLEEGSDRSRRADLLYRGIEITTLAQREHRIDVLEKQAKEKGMNLDELKDYLNFFRYGCPPHGGGGIGPGRLIMKILDLPNVREATYLPRDVKRLNP